MRQKTFVDTGKILAGISIGFSLFWLTSHPKSRLKKKLPVKEYKKISVLPNICFVGDKKIYHLHHWLVLSLIYLPLLKSKKMRKLNIMHGLFWGSILQGLMYKDRFQFRYPHTSEKEILLID